MITERNFTEDMRRMFRPARAQAILDDPQSSWRLVDEELHYCWSEFTFRAAAFGRYETELFMEFEGDRQVDQIVRFVEKETENDV